MTERQPRRGPGVGLGIIAVLVGVSALNDWAQVILTVARGSGEPALLLVLHVLSGALGVAAAIATWRRARRAPALVLLWGIAVVALLLCVPVAADLQPEASRGIRSAAAGVAIVAAALAWATRWLLARAATRRAE